MESFAYNTKTNKKMETQMANQQQLINQMEGLLNQLSVNYQPKFTNEGPVGTLLDVISKEDLTMHQRVIVLYLIFNSNTESTSQRELCDALHISMKCVRENLNALLEMGYVKRGPKVYTWDIN